MRHYSKIIFVCDSGTSRAPMAEAILKEYTIRYPLEIDMSEKMSSQLTGEDLSPDNLLLTFEAEQREKILEQYEEASHANVQVLTELVGDELEIMNPYGGTLQSYGLCYETLNKTIQKLVNLINETD